MLSSTTALTLLLLATAVVAGAPPCICGRGGKISNSTPRCSCTCTGEYLQPDCRYRSYDIVNVDIWVPLNFRQVQSPAILSGIVDGLTKTEKLPAEVTKSVQFVGLTKSSTQVNATNLRFSMLGICSLYLKAAAEMKRPWLSYLNIQSVMDAYKLPPGQYQPLEFVDRIVIYSDSRGIVMTADDIGWFIGAVVVVFLLMALEKCLFYNTVAHQAADAGAFMDVQKHR